MPGHPPDLPGHFNTGRFSVGPGNSNNHFGNRGEKARRQLREHLSGLVRSDVDGALNLGFWAGDHSHGSSGYGCGNEVFAIDQSALKCAKHGARSHFAIVDRKAGDLRIVLVLQDNSRLPSQRRQLHSLLPLPTSGARSEMSTSRVLSGMIPNSGPIRGTNRPTTGAALNAAVR